MLRRNVLTKMISKAFFANLTFVPILNFEFGGISTPSRALIVPTLFVLCNVCPDSTFELG